MAVATVVPVKASAWSHNTAACGCPCRKEGRQCADVQGGGTASGAAVWNAHRTGRPLSPNAAFGSGCRKEMTTSSRGSRRAVRQSGPPRRPQRLLVWPRESESSRDAFFALLIAYFLKCCAVIEICLMSAPTPTGLATCVAISLLCFTAHWMLS